MAVTRRALTRCAVCAKRIDGRQAPTRADGRRLCDECEAIDRVLQAMTVTSEGP